MRGVSMHMCIVCVLQVCDGMCVCSMSLYTCVSVCVSIRMS